MTTGRRHARTGAPARVLALSIALSTAFAAQAQAAAPGPGAPAPATGAAAPAQGAAPGPAGPEAPAPGGDGHAPGAKASPPVLSLDEAVQNALAHQPQILQANAQYQAASARADEARSGLLPQLTGSASYQRRTSNFVTTPGVNASGGATSFTPRPASWDTTSYWSFQATLTQLIYDFGQTSGRWRAQLALSDAQRDSARATSLQVVLAVRTAFFNARAARDLVGVARETLANQQAHLRQIEAFVRLGTRPEIDLAQARTNVANAQVQLINAENGYATARAQLSQAMGVEGPTDYEVGSETLPTVEGEDGSTDALLPEALRGRPDLASSEQQARAQELTIGSVRGAYFPALGFSTGITDAGLALDQTAWNWSAAVTLTWNLFQGGLTRATVQEAHANLDAARAQIELVKQQVRVDVETARLAVRAGRQALEAAGVALVNAREQLRLAEGRYQAGAGSSLELSDAQLALTSAAAQRVQAEYNLSTSRAQLLRALGREVPRA